MSRCFQTPIPLNLASAKGEQGPLPLPQDCADIDVTPVVDGRVFKTRYSRPIPSRACCTDPVGEPVPRFDFVNQPPVVIAGTYDTLYIPNGDQDFVVFHPVITDDGLPDGTVSSMWSVDSGPGPVVFDDVTRPDTAAHFSVPGTYVLRLSANDGQKEGFDTTTITVVHNDAPVVFAGADQLLTLEDGNVDFISPDATATDDGVPGPLFTGWSVVSGPTGGCVIDAAYDLHTAFHFSIAGTYVLQLDAQDSILSATPSKVTITVQNADIPTHTVSLRLNGAGAQVDSTPDGFDFTNYMPSGIADYSHDWDEGTVITIVFTDNGNTAMVHLKKDGIVVDDSMVVVTPPDIDGFGGARSYTFTLTANTSLEYLSVPADF